MSMASCEVRAGKVGAKIAEIHVLSELKDCRVVQDFLYESDFDRILRRPGSDGVSGSNENE